MLIIKIFIILLLAFVITTLFFYIYIEESSFITQSMAGSSSDPTRSSSSVQNTNLAKITDVDIDADGTFKYILIKYDIIKNKLISCC